MLPNDALCIPNWRFQNPHKGIPVSQMSTSLKKHRKCLMIIFFRLQLSGDFTRHQAYSADYGATSDRAFVEAPLHFIRLAIKKNSSRFWEINFVRDRATFLKISIRSDSKNCIWKHLQASFLHVFLMSFTVGAKLTARWKWKLRRRGELYKCYANFQHL